MQPPEKGITVIFTRQLINKILGGEKTSTIRKKALCKEGSITNLMENKDYSKLTGKRIKVVRIYPMKLRDGTNEIAQKDGFKDVEELKRFWTDRFHLWDSNQIVYIHEFEVVMDRSEG